MIIGGTRVKIELFSREGQIFPGGRIFIFFPEIVKYRIYYVLNCYLAINCPKPTPQPHFGTFPKGVDHCSRGVKPPTPPSIFTLEGTKG